MKPGSKAKVRNAKKNEDIGSRIQALDVLISNTRTAAWTPYMSTHLKKRGKLLDKVRKLEEQRHALLQEVR